MRTVALTEQPDIEQVIKACRTCYLGVCGADMQPYVLPMNFGYDDGVVYLHSGQFGRKWEIMKANPKVCITFCDGDELAWQDEHIACSWRVKSRSVIVEGEVEFVEDFDEKVEILNILMAQYSDREFKYSEPAVRNVGIMKVKIQTQGAKSFGEKAITPWNKNK